MPASLYQSHFNTSCMERIQGTNSGSMEDLDSNRSEWKVAEDILRLCNLQSFATSSNSFGTSSSVSGSSGNLLAEPGLNCGLGGLTTSQLEQQKVAKQSQNMTECVPVPTSEHVAEIVGRQGCKIKALRAKTNTYIKTPVRGDEPVFVVTGRKEDVNLAKREILSAAEHFSQIRASRKNQPNSTVGYGVVNPGQPGQTTIQVRVPYRVVGLVVGPKGATIKRIQQQTSTYIVTPSRDKEPVFEVTGQPEMVEAARKEIEAHIELRTGSGAANDNQMLGSGSIDDTFSPSLTHNSGGNLNNGPSGLISDYIFNAKFPGETNGQESINSISRQQGGLTDSLNGSSSFYGNSNEIPSISRLKSLLDGNNSFDAKFDLSVNQKRTMDTSSISSLWKNSDSSWRCSSSGDSGLGHSPPFDFTDNNHTGHISAWSNGPSRIGGPRDSPIDRNSPSHLDNMNMAITKPCSNDLTHRSASIDLGIPGSMLGSGNLGMGSEMNSTSSESSCSSSASGNQTNSLPYAAPTLRNLISAGFSTSLDTLSLSLGNSSLGNHPITQDSSSDKLLEGLAGTFSRQGTISPEHHLGLPLDQGLNIGSAFSSTESKPLGLW